MFVSASEGFVNCNSNFETFLISYKFAGSQQHFDESVHLTRDPLDRCHDLFIQASRTTAWQICDPTSPSKTYNWAELSVLQVIGSRLPSDGNAIPLQAWTGSEGSRRLRLPDFKTIGT